MTWTVDYESFGDFRKAIANPDLVFASGYLAGSPRRLSLTTLSEELEGFFVAGARGWRAQVYGDGRRLRTLQASAGPGRRSRPCLKPKTKRKSTLRSPEQVT